MPPVQVALKSVAAIRDAVLDGLAALNTPGPEPVTDLSPGSDVWDTLIDAAQPPHGQSSVTTFRYTFQPYSVICRLTTSAAAGLRTIRLEYQDANGARYALSQPPVSIDPSNEVTVSWFPGVGVASWANDVLNMPLPVQPLQPNFRLAVIVGAIDSGDALDRVRIAGRFTAPADRQAELEPTE